MLTIDVLALRLRDTRWILQMRRRDVGVLCTIRLMKKAMGLQLQEILHPNEWKSRRE